MIFTAIANPDGSVASLVSVLLYLDLRARERDALRRDPAAELASAPVWMALAAPGGGSRRRDGVVSATLRRMLEQLTAAVRGRRVSSEELVRLLERIERLNPRSTR